MDVRPSPTAQRIATYRLGFDRLAAPHGDPAADEALARDVAGANPAPPEAMLVRYLRARTAFFDRVVVNALERKASQVVVVGAGYDGRAWRYGRSGVGWWEVDHPATQADKQDRVTRLGLTTDGIRFVACDLEAGGVAAALTDTGFEPDAPSLFYCEGVAVYLTDGALLRVLGEMRALTAPGTRFAISFATTLGSDDGKERRRRYRDAVAALGEPVRSSLTAGDATAVLAETRWQPVEISERAQAAGLVMASPLWAPGRAGLPASQGRVAAFMERMLYRGGDEDLAAHLEAVYGVAVRHRHELDLGVHAIERVDGSRWVARVFPAVRPVDATRGDAELLDRLGRAGFPAERTAATDPVSLHHGQSVLVTELAPGRKLPATPDGFERLGRLLGQLHALPPDGPPGSRPGGAWHHLLLDADPRAERIAAAELLDAAQPRVASDKRHLYHALADDLDALDDALDDAHDLPHALVHPDLVPGNVVAADDSTLTVIDWAGAGWGPRIVSLGCLLWAASARGPGCVLAALAGYQTSITLQPDELERLGPAMCIRPLVLAIWTFATGRNPLDAVTQEWQDWLPRIDRATHAVHHAIG